MSDRLYDAESKGYSIESGQPMEILREAEQGTSGDGDIGLAVSTVGPYNMAGHSQVIEDLKGIKRPATQYILLAAARVWKCWMPVNCQSLRCLQLVSIGSSASRVLTESRRLLLSKLPDLSFIVLFLSLSLVQEAV